MGKMFEVNSLEEMCSMMCDNVVPKDNSKIEKIVGAMIGLAVGDALGVPVEFRTSGYIRRQYGYLDKMVGGGTWGQKAGTTSDDTAMALAVAEGIIIQPEDPVPAVGEKFIQWYNGKPFDVGVCCSCVISNASYNGGDWYKASHEYDEASGGMSGGNGGLMRTAFVGLYYKTLKEVRQNAKDICGMTHWNQDARNDCALMSMIIHSLVDGGGKEVIEDRVMEFSSERFDLGRIEGYPFAIEPSGSSFNSMACALHCVLTTHSFKNAVMKAVNMGGDADTIGAITGAMAGALYGIDEIPIEWIKVLDKKIVNRVIKACSSAVVNRLGYSKNSVSKVWNGVKEGGT